MAGNEERNNVALQISRRLASLVANTFLTTPCVRPQFEKRPRYVPDTTVPPALKAPVKEPPEFWSLVNGEVVSVPDVDANNENKVMQEVRTFTFYYPTPLQSLTNAMNTSFFATRFARHSPESL